MFIFIQCLLLKTKWKQLIEIIEFHFYFCKIVREQRNEKNKKILKKNASASGVYWLTCLQIHCNFDSLNKTQCEWCPVSCPFAIWLWLEQSVKVFFIWIKFHLEFIFSASNAFGTVTHRTAYWCLKRGEHRCSRSSVTVYFIVISLCLTVQHIHHFLDAFGMYSLFCCSRGNLSGWCSKQASESIMQMISIQVDTILVIAYNYCFD